MRRRVVVMMLGVLAGCVIAQDAVGQSGKTWEMRIPPKTTPAPLTVEPAEIVLGDMRPGEKFPAEVVITNTGDETIVIGETRSTCWCAVTELSDQSIGPGESVVLAGEVEAPDELGMLERHVYMFVEGYSQPIGIPIRGEVSRGIRVRTEPAPGMMGFMLAHLESVDGEAFAVQSVGSTTRLGELGEAPDFADDFDPQHDELRGKYTVRVPAPMTSGGYLNTWIGIETDREGVPVIDLNLQNRGGSAKQRPPTAFKSERVYLGAVRAGETVRVSNIALLPGGDAMFAVDSVECAGGLEAKVMGGGEAKEGPEVGFGITVTRSEPGVVMGEVRVRFATGARGSFYVIGKVVE